MLVKNKAIIEQIEEIIISWEMHIQKVSVLTFFFLYASFFFSFFVTSFLYLSYFATLQFLIAHNRVRSMCRKYFFEDKHIFTPCPSRKIAPKSQ